MLSQITTYRQKGGERERERERERRRRRRKRKRKKRRRRERERDRERETAPRQFKVDCCQDPKENSRIFHFQCAMENATMELIFI